MEKEEVTKVCGEKGTIALKKAYPNDNDGEEEAQSPKKSPKRRSTFASPRSKAGQGDRP